VSPGRTRRNVRGPLSPAIIRHVDKYLSAASRLLLRFDSQALAAAAETSCCASRPREAGFPASSENLPNFPASPAGRCFALAVFGSGAAH
jgi:hypothetical protein